MKKWMMATSTVALIAALAGCNSGSSNDDDDSVAVHPRLSIQSQRRRAFR